MTTYEFNSLVKEFKFSLKQEVKKGIKGVVTVNYVDDVLVVEIYGANSIVYHYTRKNIMSEIAQGVSSKTIAYIIVQRYKDYILDLYFM